MPRLQRTPPPNASVPRWCNCPLRRTRARLVAFTGRSRTCTRRTTPGSWRRRGRRGPPGAAATATRPSEGALDRMAVGAFLCLCHHLRDRSDAVPNVDLMAVGGFCRNCLSKVRARPRSRLVRDDADGTTTAGRTPHFVNADARMNNLKNEPFLEF